MVMIVVMQRTIVTPSVAAITSFPVTFWWSFLFVICYLVFVCLFVSDL